MEKIHINASFLCTKAAYGIVRYGMAMCLGLREELRDKVVFLVPPGWAYSPEAEKLGLTIVGKIKSRPLWEQVDLPIYLMRLKSPLLINFSNTGPFFYANQIYTIYDLFFKTTEPFIKNNREHYSSLYIHYANLSYRLLLKLSKRIITISEYTEQEVHKNYGISLDKMDVVYPCIEDRFVQAKSTFPNKYGTYIVGVSSVKPNKNFDGLIKAFIHANLPADVSLVIVGGNESFVKNYSFSNLLDGRSNIHFTGYISDEELISIYKHALFFVYPSFFEGFGIPPTEAMACGCPVIISNVTSLPEVGGDAVLYVDPYDTNSISDTIKTLYADPDLRKELTKKGYERIKLFAKDKSIDSLMNAIGKVTSLPNNIVSAK